MGYDMRSTLSEHLDQYVSKLCDARICFFFRIFSLLPDPEFGCFMTALGAKKPAMLHHLTPSQHTCSRETNVCFCSVLIKPSRLLCALERTRRATSVGRCPSGLGQPANSGVLVFHPFMAWHKVVTMMSFDAEHWHRSALAAP